MRSGAFSLIPSPSEVLVYLYRAVANGSLLHATFITCKRLALGYSMGAAIGLPLGLLCARFTLVKDTLGTLALGMQSLPSVCWVPIALLTFGLQESALLFIAIMGSVWCILLTVDHSVRNVPIAYVRAARTMGSRGFHLWLFVILPATLPFVVSGMKQGWAFAWRSLMAAEIFVPVMSGLGLGQLLQYGRDLHAMHQVVGIMIVLMTIGVIADKCIFAPIECTLHLRWGTNRLN